MAEETAYEWNPAATYPRLEHVPDVVSDNNRSRSSAPSTTDNTFITRSSLNNLDTDIAGRHLQLSYTSIANTARLHISLLTFMTLYFHTGPLIA